MNDRFQKVFLNGQWSNWQPVPAGVPQKSILGRLFFLIYINDLPDGSKCNAKLFADNTSLFSVIKNKKESASDLRDDLDMTSTLAYNWKCHSIQTPKNPLTKNCSLEKNSNIIHPIIYFNDVLVQRANQQKHLGIVLDEKLNFKCHVDKDKN